jgi:hypothetical protein
VGFIPEVSDSKSSHKGAVQPPPDEPELAPEVAPLLDPVPDPELVPVVPELAPLPELDPVWAPEPELPPLPPVVPLPPASFNVVPPSPWFCCWLPCEVLAAQAATRRGQSQAPAEIFMEL